MLRGLVDLIWDVGIGVGRMVFNQNATLRSDSCGWTL